MHFTKISQILYPIKVGKITMIVFYNIWKFHFTKIEKKKDLKIVKIRNIVFYNNWILQKMQKLDLTKIAKITKFAKK